MIAMVVNSKQKIDELLTATTISSILALTTLPPMPPPSTAKSRILKLTLLMHEGTAFETAGSRVFFDGL